MNYLIKVGRFVFKYKFMAIFSIVFMLSYSVFTVAPAHFSQEVVDYLLEHVEVGEKIPVKQFVLVGIGLMLILAAKGLSFFLQNYMMGRLAQKAVRDMRDALYKRIISMPIGFFNKQPSGELISRFTVDFVTLNEAIIVGVVGPLKDMPTVILLFIVMFNRSWQLTLAALVLLPLVSKLIAIFGQKSNLATNKRLNKFGELSSLISETITGIRVVKAFIMEGYEIQRFKNENQRLYKHFMESVFIGSYSVPLLEISIGIYAVLLFAFAGHLISTAQMTIGDLTSFLMSFAMLNAPIRALNGISLKVNEGISAATRIFQILDSEEKIEEKENAIDIPPIQNEISVQIKRFAYEEETVLKDIDLILKAGTIIALVGSSGGGKSTLANLIPRFYDIPEKDGCIMIDGIDIRHATLRSLRSQMATVTQEIVLFDDTVRNNISYGNQECSEEMLIAAARAGRAHDFILKLPDKYEQRIGEKGVTLSGGQRQRIAISRALIKNAPILVLDEATSALDSESEMEVQAAIENLMKNRTTLVIAHRLSTIQNADVIHVLKGGQIVESGNHHELIAVDGEYKRLYDMQFKDSNGDSSSKPVGYGV